MARTMTNNLLSCVRIVLTGYTEQAVRYAMEAADYASEASVNAENAWYSAQNAENAAFGNRCWSCP